MYEFRVALGNIPESKALPGLRSLDTESLSFGRTDHKTNTMESDGVTRAFRLPVNNNHNDSETEKTSGPVQMSNGGEKLHQVKLCRNSHMLYV